MGIAADEEVGVRGACERDEVTVTRIRRQARLRRGIVDDLGLEAYRREELGGLAGLEVAGDLGSRQDACELVEPEEETIRSKAPSRQRSSRRPGGLAAERRRRAALAGPSRV